jgi:hypothetical protein
MDTGFNMHHCFTILDIIKVIFDFYDLVESEEDKRTVVALTRTCRAFGDPALDRLWCSLKSLRPLFKCLPEESWEEQEFDPDRGHTRMVSRHSLLGRQL